MELQCVLGPVSRVNSTEMDNTKFSLPSQGFLFFFGLFVPAISQWLCWLDLGWLSLGQCFSAPCGPSIQQATLGLFR